MATCDLDSSDGTCKTPSYILTEEQVKKILEQQPELATMTENELRAYFHNTMNIFSIRTGFHILGAYVHLDKIFISKPCTLYCKMYTHMY